MTDKKFSPGLPASAQESVFVVQDRRVAIPHYSAEEVMSIPPFGDAAALRSIAEKEE